METIDEDLSFISQHIPYEKVREYLLKRGVAKPGKGMKQMIDTIKKSAKSARFVSELKKVYVMMSPSDKKRAKRKVGQRKIPIGPGYRQKMPKSNALFIDDDEECGDDTDFTMTRLKEALALRGKSTIGNSYPVLVKRLLDALDDEDCDDDDASTMERLKVALALRGKTTVGNAYGRLVKRLLDALDCEEVEEDD